MTMLERCGLSEITTPSWTLEEDARGFAAAGFGAIGVWAHKLERPTIEAFWIPSERIGDEVVGRARAAVDASGLHVSHLILSGFYTGPDPYEARVEHTLHLLDVAERLGADTLVIAPGRRHGRSFDETEAVAARAITEVLERSPGSDVKLALEPIVPALSDYLNTLGEAIRLAELIDHPRVGVWPDTYHLWRTGTLFDDIERAGKRIFGIHLDDWRADQELTRQLPGDGEVPLVDVVRALEAVGYAGTYDCEYSYDQELAASDPETWSPEAVVERAARAMSITLEEALS